jgi:lysozyme
VIHNGGPRRWWRRRWVGGLAGFLVVVLVVVGVGWFVWLPRYRPGLHAGESYGVDVSNHQGQIDWLRVADDHIKFAYIKATEGADYVDPRFGTNWQDAAAAGVDRGAYHFFTLCSPGAAQAHNFLHVVPRDVGSLSAAVDLELAGNCHARPTAAEVRTELTTFVDLVRAETQRDVTLYIGDDFADRYSAAIDSGSRLWLRRFLRRPSDHRWVTWQVSAFAHVHGIHGHVDLDVGR